MSEYYDKYGMVRPKKNEDGENDIVFIAYEDTYKSIGKEHAHLILYLHINKEGYIRQSPWDDRLASHDNITAFLYLARKYEFINYALKVKQILTKFWHPRDLLFLAGVTDNPFLLFNLRPHSKSRPGKFGQWIIHKLYNYQHTNQMPSGYQEYYVPKQIKFPILQTIAETLFINKENGHVLIQYSEETLDGKLLNLLRFRANEKAGKPSITLRLADRISQHYFDYDYLRKWFYMYFNKDDFHPVIELSKNSYQGYKG